MRRLAITAFAVALLGLGAAGANAGGEMPVRDGHYAGGADRFHIFFSVENRHIGFARPYSQDLQPCTGLGGPGVFGGGSPIDADGKFKLTDTTTHANSDFVVKGRFVTAERVKGVVRWTTTANCPADTYRFEYVAKRYAPSS